VGPDRPGERVGAERRGRSEEPRGERGGTRPEERREERGRGGRPAERREPRRREEPVRSEARPAEQPALAEGPGRPSDAEGGRRRRRRRGGGRGRSDEARPLESAPMQEPVAAQEVEASAPDS